MKSYLLKLLVIAGVLCCAMQSFAAGALTVTSAIAAQGGGYQVTLTTAVTQPVLVYTVQDQPPTGWVVSNISDSGIYDAVNGKVKWVFLDGVNRVLTYTATPPSAGAGWFTFTGSYAINNAVISTAIPNTGAGTRMIIPTVTLSASPASPRALNTPITITASNAGVPNVEYEFQIDGVVSRAYAASNSYVWTPSLVGDIKTSKLKVRYRDSTTPANASAFSQEVDYEIKPALAVVNPNPSPAASTRVPGQVVTFTADTKVVGVAGGANVEYKFTDTVSGVTTVLRDFSADNIYQWTAPALSSATPVTHALKVIARDLNGANPNTTVDSATSTFVINPALSAVSVAATQPSDTEKVGTIINLTATATGGADVEYKFMIDGVDLTGYQAAATTTWTPTVAGTHDVAVIARDKNGIVATTEVASPNVSYVVKDQLTDVTLSAPANTLLLSKSLLLTATATGGKSLTYKYYENAVLLATTASNTYTWTPAASGAKALTVTATDIDLTAVTSDSVNVDVTGPLTGVALAVTVDGVASTTSVVGKTITLTATATGGNSVVYKFLCGSAGTTVLQDFSSNNVCIFTPQFVNTHKITVVAKDIKGVVPTATFTSAPVVSYPVVATLSKVTVSAVPAAGCQVGDTVTLTATPTGGVTANLEYRFMDGSTQLTTVGGSTTDVDGNPVYQSLATYTWTPSTAGTHNIYVIARDKGGVNPLTQVASNFLPYSVTSAISSVSLAIAPTTSVLFGNPVVLTATVKGGTSAASLQYEFFKTTNPGAVTTAVTPAIVGTNNYTWTPVVGEVGTYYLTVKVTDTVTLATLTSNATAIPFEVKGALSAVSVAFTAPAPVAGSILTGNVVSFTATPTGGSSAVQYKFMDDTTIIRDFSTVTTCQWVATVGAHANVKVYARETGDTTDGIASAAMAAFTVKDPLSANGLTLVASPSEKALFGQQVTLTATATEGSIDLEYQFMNGTVILSKFNAAIDASRTANNVYKFTPGYLKTYYLTVQVRDKKATDPTAIVTASALPLVVTPALTSVSLAASATTVLVNTPINFTATAKGGALNNYTFTTTGVLPVVPVASIATTDGALTTNTATWTPTAAGTYNVVVSTTDVSTGGAGPFTSSLTITVNPTPPAHTDLTAVSVASFSETDVASTTFASGAKVKLKATATGGGSTVLYKFMYGSVVLRDFSSSNTYTWTPAAVKTYSNVTVVAKDTLGVDPAATLNSSAISFTVYRPLTSVSLATNPLTTIAAGGLVTLTATANGGILANQTYTFYLDGVAIAPALAAGVNTKVWNTAAVAAGPHTLSVNVVDNNGTVAVGDDITVTSFNKTFTIQ